MIEPFMVAPVGLSAVQDRHGELHARRLRRTLSDHDILVGEFLDEELAIAAGDPTGVSSWSARATSLGPEAWATSVEVARRHLVAFAYADLDGEPVFDVRLAAEVVDPGRRRVRLRHRGRDDLEQVFVVRDDGSVLHDHVDRGDDLHLVVLRNLARSRGILRGSLALDDVAACEVVVHDPGGGRRFVLERTDDGIVMVTDDERRPVGRSDVAAMVDDLLH